MTLELFRCIGSSGSAGARFLVDLVMAVRAKRDCIINLIRTSFLARFDVMDLHSVEGSTDTATPASFGKQLVDLFSPKAHSSPYN
jgi:hypothetical protein